ncbi:MAG: hypothetical protein K0U93_26290 [Gammaproteobacteria bacterium]|nr:hypothetical protein [Gammaproteobacteria bacterium]
MSQVDESSISRAEAAVSAYIAAFNKRDAPAMAAAFNFPHIRLAKGQFVVIETAEHFVSRQNIVTEMLIEEGWDHTVVEHVNVVHAGTDKVHLELEITRRHASQGGEPGEVYSRFQTLWIATHQDGQWGIQFRSSFLESNASTLGDPAK